MIPALLLTTAVLSLPGQAATPSPKIVNGEAESGHPAVVALGAGSGNYAFSACTGSLITPRLILSAGHCGDGIPLETVVELGQAFFTDDVTEADSDDIIGFDDLTVHPDYVALANGVGGTLGEFDVSFLVLEDDAPVTPVRINPDALSETDIGLEMLSVGFGITSGSGSGGGEKRSATLVLDEVDDMFLYSLTETNPDESQICSGDSGGPQFAQLDDSGEWVQVAVHSWGDTGCAYESGSTRVDIAWDFIMEQVEAEHGTTDLCEINSRYDDGTCDAWCDAVDPDCVEPEDEAEAGDAKSCSSLGLLGGGLLLLPGLVAARRRQR